jgi:hypothetical protein
LVCFCGDEKGVGFMPVNILCAPPNPDPDPPHRVLIVVGLFLSWLSWFPLL